MAVEGFAVLELDQHWVPLRGGEEAERQLRRGVLVICVGLGHVSIESKATDHDCKAAWEET